MVFQGAKALIFAALCLWILSFTACLARRRVITRRGGTPSQKLITADKPTLLARLAETYKSIDNFSVTVDMVPALGSTEKSKITEYKDVRGYILFRKPEHIRIIGLFPVVRHKAFDMVSNGTKFKLYLPSKNRFVIGSKEITTPSSNKFENLRPHHFLEALLVQPAGANETSLLENFTDEENAAYILHFVHNAANGELALARTVWFDRLSLRIVRQVVFDQSVNILTDARYSDWKRYDGVLFPRHIEINRPLDEYGVVLTVVKMEINKGIPDEKFALEQPEGAQLQVLGEPKPAPEPKTPRAKGIKKK